MLSDILRVGGKISLWGAIMYGTIVPAYRSVESINSLTQFVHSARENIEARTDRYRAEQFEGIFRYVERKEREGEQKAIHGFRREIGKKFGIGCDTVDDRTYDMPRIELGKSGAYELRMECGGRILAVPLGKIELR